MRPAAFLLLPLLVACDEFHLSDVVPQVTFDRMEVEEIDFQHIDADFVFTIENPNPVGFELSSFSWAFALEDTPFLSGAEEDGFRLEAVGSSELAIPVSLLWSEAWDTVQATRGVDHVDFDLDGHFGFMTRLGEARVPYDVEGDFPALRTPRFALKGVRVQSLDLLTQEAQLAVDLGVDNAHASTLWFERFDYTVALDGQPVASGLIQELGGAEGAAETGFTLPITVDLLGLGTEVVRALTNRDRIQVSLDAGMDVDTPFGILPLSIDERGRVSVE